MREENNLILIHDEIRHHGILGMRWGIRRFQPYPKGSNKGKEVGKAARVKKESPPSKEYLIEKASPKEVKKYRSTLNTREVQSALNRISTDKRLSDVSRRKDYVKEFDKYFKNVKSINSWFIAITLGAKNLKTMLGFLGSMGKNGIKIARYLM